MEHQIPISDELAEILTRPDLRTETKEDLIRSMIESRCEELEELLQPYLNDTIRGTIAADSIKLSDDAVALKDDDSGTVWVEFDEEAYYGCRDMDKLDDHTEQLELKVLPYRNCILLRGIDRHERDPDEP